MIHTAIERSFGHDQLNELVTSEIQTWIMGQAQSLLMSQHADEGYFTLVENVSELFECMSTTEAVEKLRNLVQMCRDSQASHDHTIRISLMLADRLAQCGEHAKEEIAQLYRDCEQRRREILQMCRETSGDVHPDTIEAVYALALMLRRSWRRGCSGDEPAEAKLAEAEQLCRKALQACRATLGNQLRNTWGGLNTHQCATLLSELLEDKGDCASAEQVVREIIDGLGDELQFRLAELMCKQGDTGSAERLLRAMFNRGATFDSRTGVCPLAKLMHQQGNSEAAEVVYRKVISQREQRAGISQRDKVRDTVRLKAVEDLSTLLLERGDKQGAEPLLREHLQILRSTNRNLAEDLMRLQDAMLLLIECIGDPESLRARGKFERAEEAECLFTEYFSKFADMGQTSEAYEAIDHLLGESGLESGVPST